MGKFTFTETEIPGVVVIEPQVFGDDRGYFMETYQKDQFAAAGIDKEFGLRESIEVFCSAVVQTVVVLVFLYTVGEFSRYAGCPYYHILLLHVVVEEFRCPHIDGGGVFHHFDETLRCPVYQIFRR